MAICDCVYEKGASLQLVVLLQSHWKEAETKWQNQFRLNVKTANFWKKWKNVSKFPTQLQYHMIRYLKYFLEYPLPYMTLQGPDKGPFS